MSRNVQINKKKIIIKRSAFSKLNIFSWKRTFPSRNINIYQENTGRLENVNWLPGNSFTLTSSINVVDYNDDDGGGGEDDGGEEEDDDDNNNNNKR